MIRESGKAKGSSTPLNLLTCPPSLNQLLRKEPLHSLVRSFLFFFPTLLWRVRSYCGLPLKAVCMCFGGVCLALVAGPWCLCKCQRLCRYWLLCNGCVPLCSPTQLAPGGLLLQYCLSSDVHQTATSLSLPFPFSASQPLLASRLLSRSLDMFFLGQCPVDVCLSTLNNLEKFLSSCQTQAWAVRQSEWSVWTFSHRFSFSPSLTNAVFSLCSNKVSNVFFFFYCSSCFCVFTQK